MKKNIYVPEDMNKFWEELEELAETNDRSVSYLVNQAVKEYIEKNN